MEITASSLKKIGTMTRWGKIVAVGRLSGERYYFMIDRYGTVAMIPATMVEAN